MKFLGVFLLALPLVVRAEAVGVAYLAAQGYTTKQCRAALTAFDRVPHPMLAILWGTFSTNNTCASQFLQRFRGKPHTLEIHFSNEAGRRNRRLGPGELAAHLDVRGYNRALARGSVSKRVRARAEEIKRFLEKEANETTRVLLSTGLEDNFTREAYREIAKTLKEVTGFTLVRSPLHSTSYFPFASFIELHGHLPRFPKGRACISSLDGTDIDFGGRERPLDHGISLLQVRSYLHRTRGCARLLWWSGQQGIERGRFVKPRSRSFRLRPSDINTVNKLLRTYGR